MLAKRIGVPCFLNLSNRLATRGNRLPERPIGIRGHVCVNVPKRLIVAHQQRPAGGNRLIGSGRQARLNPIVQKHVDCILTAPGHHLFLGVVRVRCLDRHACFGHFPHQMQQILNIWHVVHAAHRRVGKVGLWNMNTYRGAIKLPVHGIYHTFKAFSRGPKSKRANRWLICLGWVGEGVCRYP